MHQERREFLKQLAAACAAGFTRNLGIGAAVAGASAAAGAGAGAAAASAAPAVGAATTAAVGAYGTGVRAQVFEVVVRQAIAGAPWRELCAGPLRVNGISETEIELEIARRQLYPSRPVPRISEYSGNYNLKIERFREHRLALDKIPHSEIAPCPCNSCAIEIRKIRNFDWTAQ